MLEALHGCCAAPLAIAPELLWWRWLPLQVLRIRHPAKACVFFHTGVQGCLWKYPPTDLHWVLRFQHALSANHRLCVPEHVVLLLAALSRTLPDRVREQSRFPVRVSRVRHSWHMRGVWASTWGPVECERPQNSLFGVRGLVIMGKWHTNPSWLWILPPSWSDSAKVCDQRQMLQLRVMFFFRVINYFWR